MPFKTDATGAIVMMDHSGKKLPVFVNAKGEEHPFDPDSTVETISRLNSEAKSHREGKEKAELLVKTFEGIDPAKAREALDMVSKLDAKKLVDAGEIERVRAEIGKNWQGKLEEATAAKAALEERIYQMTIGGAFANSKYIKEKFAIPPDFVQARFAENFGIENDKVFAVDSTGNKIYSKTRPGELADFDEALEFLVAAHPHRDSLLKGTGASGTGAQQSGGGGAGGTRTVTRSAWTKLPPAEQAKAGKEYALVDG